MLKRRGIAATIRFGVTKHEDGLAAHAWLIVGDQTVLGGEIAPGFQPLADLGGRCLMTVAAEQPSRENLILSIARFLREYAAYSGRKGLVSAVLVLLGALFEGIGLALIAPLLAVLFHGKGAGGSLRRLAETVFGWFGATSDFGRLLLLLGIFAGAMVVRAVVLLARDVTLAELRVGFVDAQRMRVAEALAAADAAIAGPSACVCRTTSRTNSASGNQPCRRTARPLTILP